MSLQRYAVCMFGLKLRHLSHVFLTVYLLKQGVELHFQVLHPIKMTIFLILIYCVTVSLSFSFPSYSFFPPYTSVSFPASVRFMLLEEIESCCVFVLIKLTQYEPRVLSLLLPLINSAEQRTAIPWSKESAVIYYDFNFMFQFSETISIHRNKAILILITAKTLLGLHWATVM